MKVAFLRLPQQSRGRDLFSFMHLDCVSSQDGGTRLARSLAAVDEENFFLGKSRVATKRWAIHMTLPKRRALFRAGDSDKVCAERERESTENIKGHNRAFWGYLGSLYWRLVLASSCEIETTLRSRP